MPRTPDHAAYLRAKYFPSLDGLRALSILAVVWYHVPELRPIWKTGFLGVHLFFVISGFLITTLLLRERSENGSISLRNFYARRTLRIFPAYYLTLVLFLIACLAIPMLRSESLATYLHNLPSFLTYTSNWFVYPWGAGPGLPPSRVVFVAAWSLATEEQFYLFWPWVLAFSKRWFTPLLVMFALIAVNEIIKVRFGYWFFLSGHSLPVTILNSISTAICMGCLVAIVLNRASGYKAASRIFGQSWSVPLFVAIMLFVCVVPNDDTLHVLRMFYICAAMAAALTACIMRPDHLLKPLFVNPVMKYIGTISYGMYLYHAFGINIADRLFGFSKSWPLLQFVVVTATTVGIASVSYWTFEKFFLRLKSKFSSRTYKEQPPTEVVPAVAS